MKTTITVTLDIEIARQLKEEENASGLINDILKKHFELGKLTFSQSSREKEILEEVKKKMEKEEGESKELEENKIFYEFMNKNRAEYNKGFKAGSWKTIEEFYKKKHEQEAI